MEGHPGVVEPVADRGGLLARHALHLGDQRALGQPLLVDAERIEQLVVEDRVVHPHAAFVEDADDRLLGPQLLGERAAQLDLGPAAGHGEVADVAHIMDELAGLEPGLQTVDRPGRR
ncbi:MAG: hypothetical protein WKF83_14285 [Nocardioidaceae bacterium]